MEIHPDHTQICPNCLLHIGNKEDAELVDAAEGVAAHHVADFNFRAGGMEQCGHRVGGLERGPDTFAEPSAIAVGERDIHRIVLDVAVVGEFHLHAHRCVWVIGGMPEAHHQCASAQRIGMHGGIRFDVAVGPA